MRKARERRKYGRLGRRCQASVISRPLSVKNIITPMKWL